ncbi:kinetochore protein spc25 [Colletotrichum karsti]|uniref:Kinetochore protein SPC25 n=1 Tax=Colletotrichum karsti TaxID=1095194 RepID=A0A9P6IGP0_9PEZI|nr:kinetochore protein spc25 [Colletotrichum karsti]KAF9878485.1 kinetochore protein spc25 [Colletotrichum karsti]
MSSAFESSLSASINRQSLMATPSVADTLPNANFGFEELRDRMTKFSSRFDNFIESGRKRVLEERNQFRMDIAELQESQRMKKKDIEILHHKTSTHQHTIQKEKAETREMQSAIAQLSEERDKHMATRDALKKQIEETQKEIDTRLAAQRAHAKQLEAQSRFNVPELEFWQQNLGLRIEGAGQDDRLKFVYSYIDSEDWDREAWFELSTSSRDYDIRHCRPKLERERVEKVLDQLNETRELGVLLKGMRELFVEAMKQ